MSKLKDYIQLHLNILLFSLTSVFSKAASVQYNKHGLSSPLLYLFLFLMVANCGIYAITWQQVIKKFSLSTAYANKSVYLLWSQIWAVLIFHENLSIQNIIGILVVYLEYGRCRDMNRTFILIMLSGTFFFRCFTDTSENRAQNIRYEKPNQGISQFPGDSLIHHIYADPPPQYMVLSKVDMRYGPVIDTAAYVFVLLLSHFILKEKITKGKIMGNLIIIAGILIYTL